jgi:hypothetical protein
MAPDAFLKAQRAGELAQPTRWMKGRQSFCIRRDASAMHCASFGHVARILKIVLGWSSSSCRCSIEPSRLSTSTAWSIPMISSMAMDVSKVYTIGQGR